MEVTIIIKNILEKKDGIILHHLKEGQDYFFGDLDQKNKKIKILPDADHIHNINNIASIPHMDNMLNIGNRICELNLLSILSANVKVWDINRKNFDAIIKFGEKTINYPVGYYDIIEIINKKL